MRLPSRLSVIGFIVLVIGTYCPLLRPFHLFNWNVYQLNKPYGFLLMFVGIIGVIGAVLNQPKINRLAAFISLALVAVLLLAAVLKVKTTFSFIPFKGVEGFLMRQIKFKWGWVVLFAGAILAVTGALFSKKQQTLPSQKL